MQGLPLRVNSCVLLAVGCIESYLYPLFSFLRVFHSLLVLVGNSDCAMVFRELFKCLYIGPIVIFALCFLAPSDLRQLFLASWMFYFSKSQVTFLLILQWFALRCVRLGSSLGFVEITS